ncbi:MAG: stage 0 sporulation protein J, partial [Oscillospiraceae bacterium]|nr:stage 0 sporulation protein J [Oscillospiraceae bacterium]
RVGKSRSAVANALRLLNLDEEVRKLLEQGRLSGGHARALLPLSAPVQRKAAQAVLADDLSVRQTEALVKKLTAAPKTKKSVPTDAVNYAKIAAGELSDKLGRSCRIVPGRKKGRIELDYYGLDDLNELLEALAAIKRRNGGTNQ